MSKFEKEMGTPKPADVRRVDPPAKPHKKSRRKRKEYPPHWKVSHHNFGYSLEGHRAAKHIPYLWLYGIPKDQRPSRYDLVSLLAFYAERYPETANLPLRFLNCPAVECGREIIPN